jgi:hypothetical protein
MDEAIGDDLKVKITTRFGQDPTPYDPVKLVFRDPTESSSLLHLFTITGPVSMTIPSPARLGFKSAVAARLWVVAFNDAGTLRLGVINCYSQDVDFTTAPNQIYNLSEEKKVSSELVSASSHLSGKFYTGGSAVTNLYPRVLGFIEWSNGMNTPGMWGSSEKVQNFRTGVKLPGDVVQRATNYYASPATGTIIMPLDNTIPQYNEGNEFVLTIISPASPANVMRIYSLANLSCNAVVTLAGALFRGTGPDAMAVTCVTPNVANQMAELVLEAQHIANNGNFDLSYSMHIGANIAATVYFNRHASFATAFGGTLFSCLNIEEIQA